MSVYKLLDSVREVRDQHLRRMLHKIPQMEVVPSREAWILEYCKGKRVLDIGCAGTDGKASIFREMCKCCEAYGVDIQKIDLTNTAVCDMECADELPFRDKNIDVVVAGEILEHISNPGRFLFLVQTCFPEAELVLTVPNAFSASAMSHAIKGQEAVNSDHVCWYSWKTLSTLLHRHCYDTIKSMWYNGRPFTAEGLIFICRGARHAEALPGGSEPRLVPAN